MAFGKIEYLNLIIFDIFLKKSCISSSFKAGLNARKSYPAKLNIDYLFGRIDAGFISSITAMRDVLGLQKGLKSPLGIIAFKEVWSVLLLRRDAKKDYQSASSNALCQVLGMNGEVLIGDRALKFFFNFLESNIESGELDSNNFAKKLGNLESKDFYDMANLWYKKTSLPFVFGRLCFKKNTRFYNNLSKYFYAKIGSGKKFKGIKIPYYILTSRCKELGISQLFAKKYIEKIYYKIENKEKIALLRFYRAARLKRIKAPKRF